MPTRGTGQALLFTMLRAPACRVCFVHLQHCRAGKKSCRSSSPSFSEALPQHLPPLPPPQMLNGEGEAPAACTAAVLEHIVQQHMDSPSLLAVFPLQDLLPLSPRLPDCPPERQQINDPTNPQHYWRYRLHVSLEDIAADADLRCLLADMLQAAQRYHGPAQATC